jgi:phosphoglycolate phosphatase
MLRPPRMILFDVDGTLVDSVPDLQFCVDAMQREIGQPERGEAKVRLWVGNGVERLVKRALTDSLDGEPEPAQFERAYPIFLRLYAANTSARSRLYPGIRAGLDAIKARGYRLASVTNKAAQFTLPLLRDLGVRDDFELVVSGDTLPVKKPDPAPLLHAARTLGAEPQDCLMVGDSISDVKAARAAGFQIVCMSYGYNHGQDIRLAQPDAVIDTLPELLPLLDSAA